MNTGGSNPVVLEDVQTKLVKPTVPVIGRVVSNELCMNGKSASFVKHTTFDVAVRRWQVRFAPVKPSA